MRKKMLARFKAHLEEERKTLVNQNQQQLKDYLAHTNDENRDIADLANEEYENSIKATNNTHQFYHLLEIDRALDKIEDGSYGLCDECNEEINFERLEAIPNASLCIQCQAKREKLGLTEPSNDDASFGFVLPPISSGTGKDK